MGGGSRGLPDGNIGEKRHHGEKRGTDNDRGIHSPLRPPSSPMHGPGTAGVRSGASRGNHGTTMGRAINTGGNSRPVSRALSSAGTVAYGGFPNRPNTRQRLLLESRGSVRAGLESRGSTFGAAMGGMMARPDTTESTQVHLDMRVCHLCRVFGFITSLSSFLSLSLSVSRTPHPLFLCLFFLSLTLSISLFFLHVGITCCLVFQDSGVR